MLYNETRTMQWEPTRHSTSYSPDVQARPCPRCVGGRSRDVVMLTTLASFRAKVCAENRTMWWWVTLLEVSLCLEQLLDGKTSLCRLTSRDVSKIILQTPTHVARETNTHQLQIRSVLPMKRLALETSTDMEILRLHVASVSHPTETHTA